MVKKIEVKTGKQDGLDTLNSPPCCSIRKSWNVSFQRASKCLSPRKLKTIFFPRSAIHLAANVIRVLFFSDIFSPVRPLTILVKSTHMKTLWLCLRLHAGVFSILVPVVCFTRSDKMMVLSADPLSLGNASTRRNSNTFRCRGDVALLCQLFVRLRLYNYPNLGQAQHKSTYLPFMCVSCE